MTKQTVMVIDDHLNNQTYKDMDTGVLMSQEEFIQKIEAGDYPGYYVYEKDGNKIPSAYLSQENLYGLH